MFHMKAVNGGLHTDYLHFTTYILQPTCYLHFTWQAAILIVFMTYIDLVLQHYCQVNHGIEMLHINVKQGP